MTCVHDSNKYLEEKISLTNEQQILVFSNLPK